MPSKFLKNIFLDVLKSNFLLIFVAQTSIFFDLFNLCVLSSGLPHTQGTQGIFKLKKISGKLKEF